MSLLQNELQTKGLQQTLLDHTVQAKRSADFPNLILFTYNQFDADMTDPVVRESRGIILDENSNWNIVNRAFDKFFNYGESNCANIDYSTARFLKKEDGSMISLYFYQGAWRVATTGSPDASGNMNLHEKTFRSMFWEVFHNLGGKTDLLDPQVTYLFELCTPYNKVVVNHQVSKLVILAARRHSGEYLEPVEGIAGEIPWVQSFDLSSVDAAIYSFNEIQGSGFEGYVIADASGNRIKVKHPGYVALHHFMDHKLTSPSKLLAIVLKGEVPEVLTYFPEYTSDFANLQSKLDQFKTNLLSEYQKYEHISDKKSFALAVSGSKYRSSLFLMKNRGYSVEQIIYNVSTDHLLDMLKAQ